MRYNTLALCLIAASLCFAARRTNEKQASGHRDQNIGTSNLHVAKIYEDDVKTCGELLGLFTALAGETSNITSLLGSVEACERVIGAVDKAHEENPQYHIRNQHGIDQTLVSAASKTSASRFCPERGSELDAYEFERPTFDLVRRRSKRRHRREEICEAKLCENENLDKMCNTKKIDPDAALICKMCYPTENVEMINAHCQAKWKRERRAFYIISFVLIAITILSGLCLYIRRRYLRAKNPQRNELQDNGPVEEINPPGEIYHYDGSRLESPIPAEQNPSSSVTCSPDARQRDGSNRGNSPWDDFGDDTITTTVAQRRLKNLGLFSRSGRKNVHDLFDLEALQSKDDASKSVQRKPTETHRVPVMPWAPNATVRLSDRETQRARARTVSKGSPAVEMRENLRADVV